MASLVGVPMEVDKNNLKRWEFVRVKIGCRDITKVPAVVEGVMDLHFFDFTFQREVPVEGMTNAAGTTWTRTTDRTSGDFPSPKKTKRGPEGFQQGAGTNDQTRNQSEAEGSHRQRSKDNVQSDLAAVPFGNSGKDKAVKIVSQV